MASDVYPIGFGGVESDLSGSRNKQSRQQWSYIVWQMINDLSSILDSFAKTDLYNEYKVNGFCVNNKHV